jgi:hypothetical protein
VDSWIFPCINITYEPTNNPARKSENITMGIQEQIAAVRQTLGGFTSSVGRAGDGIVSSAADLVSKMADGQTGATLYNRQVNDAARLGSDLISGIPLLGKVFGGAVSGLANAAAAAENQVAKQADAEFKNYQDLSRNGLASSMDSAFKNLTDLSYTFKDMGEGAKLLQANSAVLAAMGGGAQAGIDQFAKISLSLKTSGAQDEFLRMGKSIPDINAGILNYAKYQRQSGQIMQQDAAESSRAAQAYMMEQDKLTKMTGLSADEQQAARDQAMSTEQYAAHRFLLTQELANAKDEGTKAAIANQIAREDELLMNAKTQGTKEAAGMAMYLSGNTSSKIAQGAGMIFGNMKDQLRTMKPGEAINAANRLNAQFVKDNTDLAIYGQANQLFDIDFSQKIKSSAQATTDYTKAAEMATLKQQAQVAGEDKSTKLYTDMIQKERETSLSLQQAIHTGVPLLSKGLLEIATKSAELAGGFRHIIDSISGNSSASSAAPTSAASLGPGGAPKPFSQAELKALGFKMHEGDVQQTGKVIDPRLIELAHKIQKEFPGFSHFSGFNDKFHNEKTPASGHTQGRAVDFGVTAPPSRQEGQRLENMLRGWGATIVQDEYNNPSTMSTAGHFHAEIPRAAMGDILSGPSGGYEKTLGDAESRITLPGGKTVPARVTGSGSSSQTKHYEEELDKLDLMINIMQKQNDVATRMLRIHN